MQIDSDQSIEKFTSTFASKNEQIVPNFAYGVPLNHIKRQLTLSIEADLFPFKASSIDFRSYMFFIRSKPRGVNSSLINFYKIVGGAILITF